MPSDITFVTYDEAAQFDETQRQALKDWAGDLASDTGEKLRHLMDSKWPTITESPPVALTYIGMRKQLESERQHAQFDLPREVTNRKARRAAAAKKRRP